MFGSFFFLVLLLIILCNGDMYVQTPPGSNNRLDERNRDRNNGNRIFDSQNNNRGGYNVGKMTYYVGEQVPISWTNQHSAGKYQLQGSEVILQYMCDELARDGTSTNRIPDRPTECANFDCDTDPEYGRHESWKYYQYCKATSRNKGLFTSNQNFRSRNRQSARSTRQNPAGTRRGYECPEERDYYPYWRASPWKDIAIYTNQPGRCLEYQKESQNVKGRQQCEYTPEYWKFLQGYVRNSRGELPITETGCNAAQKKNAHLFTPKNSNQTLRKWKWVKYASHGISAPECLNAVTTRANHHGMPSGARQYWTYVWTVPNDVNPNAACVLRSRYNISTNDWGDWKSDTSIKPGVDHKYNTNASNPNADNDPCWLPIWKNFGLNFKDVNESFGKYPFKKAPDDDATVQKKSRGYICRNNPRVDPFGHILTSEGYRLQLQLAINTAQFGRTFQDRTHTFQIKPYPLKEGNKKINLVTVQGKRGNIVQVYPATEYFFRPEPVELGLGDYVHFCWTGSNTNPNNNDGQGKRGTDRSNLCPLTLPQWDKSQYGEVDGNDLEWKLGSVGDLGNSYPSYVDRPPTFGYDEYYNYQNKRDVPLKKPTTPGYGPNYKNQPPFNLEYNKHWFIHQSSAKSNMGGLDDKVLLALCLQRRVDILTQGDGLLDYGNMEELDDTGTTFCIPPQLITKEGKWNFLCTRNNNFSNRSQKGTLLVINGAFLKVTATSLGVREALIEGKASVTIEKSVVKTGESLQFTLITMYNTAGESSIVELQGLSGGKFNSDAIESGKYIELWVPYTAKSLSFPKAYHKTNKNDKLAFHSVASLETDGTSTYAVIRTNKGGFYTIQNHPNVGSYVILLLCVILLAIVLVFTFKNKCVKR